MSQHHKRIDPPPKGKNETTDDYSEVPSKKENQVPEPDWDVFPELKTKGIDIVGDATKKLENPEFKLSTLFEELPEQYE